MKRINTLIFILILCSLLCGCWDRREINDLGLVVGYAMDYTEIEGGKTGVKYTAQVANPSVMAGGMGGMAGMGGTSGAAGAGGAKAFWTVTVTGETIRGAISKMNYSIPKQIFFGHARVFVFGEKAARGGLSPFLDRTVRSRESRENNFMVMAKGDPSRILEQESPVFRATTLALNDIFRDKNGWQGIMSTTVADFDYRLSTGTTSPVTPVVEIVPQSSLSSEEKRTGINRDTIAITGLAAFDQNGRLAGFFNERETMGLMWVLNRSEVRVLTFPYPVEGVEEPVSLNLLGSKSKVVVGIGDDGLPNVDIKIHARFDVLEQFGSQRGLFDINFLDGLEKNASSQIINEVEATVKKSQQINTDVFGFGEEVRRQHHREWQQYKDQWRDIFPTLKVTVECESHIHDRELTVETPGSVKEEAGH